MQDKNLKKDTTREQEAKEKRESPEVKLTEEDKYQIVFCKTWRKSGNGNWTNLYKFGSIYTSVTIIENQLRPRTFTIILNNVDKEGRWKADTKPKYYSEYDDHFLYSIYQAKEYAFKLANSTDNI